MKTLYSFLVVLIMFPLNAQAQAGRYAQIHGLKMYYEIHGKGEALVLLHGGGSTIGTTYGRILPELATKFQIIAVELQAHGHTSDIDRPLSFEQDADDVAALLKHLDIRTANIMGFSNGGTTALQLAIRHPALVNKLVLASTTFAREGMQAGFFEGMKSASLENMPQPLKDAFLDINPDPKALEAMFKRDVTRMIQFKDISENSIKSITAPTLVINGDSDVVRVEHAQKLSTLLPNAKLQIISGGHGDYIGETCAPRKDEGIIKDTATLIKNFLGS